MLGIQKTSEFKPSNLGIKFLYIGVLVLPTAPAIALLSLIFSLLLSSNNNPINFFKEKSNKYFIIISFLMILSCIVNSFDNSNKIIEEIGSLSWISLINWIPFFWLFWSFEPYLKEIRVRKAIAKFLLIGTIPVIFSGFLQYFFNITGPFEILNGLIIWYQRPLSITDGITGPFNNANYAGAWLALVWPFSFSLFITNKNKFKKLITTLFCLLFITALLLTNSRNAWLGMFLTIPVIIGFEYIFWLIPLIILIGLFLTFLISLIPDYLRENLVSFLTINIFNNFPENSLSLQEAFPRLNIWSFSIKAIFERPLFGWGGGTFPVIHKAINGRWIGHTHNIILELAINYGILTSLILSITVFRYLEKYYKFIILNSKTTLEKIKNNLTFEKAWFASILFISYSHLFDIQYFDLRISIITWILLTGLKASMI
ncbi:O-antigen ligase family protein [Prochlorococcus marinus]|nr:O-antigen ligase family protein [Prochlorococcus marinus]